MGGCHLPDLALCLRVRSPAGDSVSDLPPPLLGRQRPRIVGGPHTYGVRVVEDKAEGALRIGCCEQHAHRGSVNGPERDRTHAADSVENGAQIVRTRLQSRRLPRPVREAGAAAVEDDLTERSSQPDRGRRAGTASRARSRYCGRTRGRRRRPAARRRRPRTPPPRRRSARTGFRPDLPSRHSRSHQADRKNTQGCLSQHARLRQ
jgi:hypothetical protein